MCSVGVLSGLLLDVGDLILGLHGSSGMLEGGRYCDQNAVLPSYMFSFSR